MDETELQGRIALLEAENAALHRSAELSEKTLAQCRSDLAQCREELTKVRTERDRAEDGALHLAEQRNSFAARQSELEEQVDDLKKKLAAAESSGHRYLAELNQVRKQRTDEFAAQTDDPSLAPPKPTGDLTVAELNMLGYCHSKGLGGPRDPEAALKYFMQAAAQNDPNAQYNVGFAFYDGRGCKQNFDNAWRWFSLAAAAGSVDARYYMGECCELGRGTEQNIAEALRHYEIAARSNDELSVVRCAELCYYGSAGAPEYAKALRYLKQLRALDPDKARELAERFRRDRIKAQAPLEVDMELRNFLESH